MRKEYFFVKSVIKFGLILLLTVGIFLSIAFIKAKLRSKDFGETFITKASNAMTTLNTLNDRFTLCSKLCTTDVKFMQSIVFPEVMRYQHLQNVIETESLRTLYVEFGEDYANFSIGLFQMKPSFATYIEQQAKLQLTPDVYKELQLAYTITNNTSIRSERIDRLDDTDWQLVYLTAFVMLCDKIYAYKNFTNTIDKLQWYSTIYNAGFEKKEDYINKKIKEENFYWLQGMPEKKFKYAALATWYYQHNDIAP